MSKPFQEWVRDEVGPLKGKPMRWLSAVHFFRDPVRATYSDSQYFMSPADGTILYQREVGPDDSILDIKGRPFSLRDALLDPDYDKSSLVIGIFMTFYDVHVNRVPFPGRLSYRLLEPIDTLNRPMFDVEASILDGVGVSTEGAEYLHRNQRMVNRIDSVTLGQSYYILQIAEYDVNCVMPFELRQNQWMEQGRRFSHIRYGSQVDLVVPLSPRWEFIPTQPIHQHVEAGLDTVIEVKPKTRSRRFNRQEKGSSDA
jgi:phosphatidylserine decarboxylase